MKFILFITCVFTSLLSFGQSPTDAEMMNKKEVCIATTYSRENWTQYWESTLLRENGNIGKLNRSVITPMVAYGILNKINFIVGASHLNANTSQGTVAGNKGMQDLGIHLKYNFFDYKSSSLLFKSFLVLGGGLPLSKYNEDAGPTSLGLGCSEVNSRLILDFSHASGVFIRPAFAYHKRGTSTLERSYYYNEKGYNSEFIDIPNQTVASITFGARLFNKSLRIESTYLKINTIGGSEIRRNEMPLANANMDASKIVGFLKYDPSFGKNFGFMLGYEQILKGQNVGKSKVISFGINYRIVQQTEASASEQKI